MTFVRGFLVPWWRFLRASWAGYLFSFIIFTVWVYALFAVIDDARAWTLNRQPVATWFEYHTLTVDPTRNGFTTPVVAVTLTRSVYRPVDATFTDQAMCGGVTVGEQTRHLDLEPAADETWLFYFDEALPKGVSCELVVTAGLEVDGVRKRTSITSNPFTVDGG